MTLDDDRDRRTLGDIEDVETRQELVTKTRREKQGLRGEERWRDVDLERTIQKSGKLAFGGTTENTESRVNRIVNPSVLGKDQERAQYRDAEGCKGKRSKKGRDKISFESLYGALYICQCPYDQRVSIVLN